MSTTHDSPFAKKTRDTRMLGTIIGIEMIVLALSLYFQFHCEMCLCGMNSIIQQLWEVVMAYSGITTAFVVFCYTMMDSRRFGIPNRTILRYFFGSYSIPLLYVIVLLKLPFFFIVETYDMLWVYIIECVLAFIEHTVIIMMILASTSAKISIKIIAKQELWQYKQIKEMKDRIPYLDIWKEPHIYQIMASDDLFSDKARFLKEIMILPLKEMKQDDIEKSLDEGEWKGESVRIYNYYFDIAYSVFDSVAEKNDEIRKLYNVFYEFLLVDLKSVMESPKKDKNICGLLGLIVDAIINAAFVCCTDEAGEFCAYIFKNIQEEELKKNRLLYHLLTLEMLYRSEPDKVSVGHLVNIRKFLSLHIGEDCMGECWNYWQLLTERYTWDSANRAKYFYNAIQTLREKEVSSHLMVYCIQKIGESGYADSNA